MSRIMTITITLPPATEERLREQAEAAGKDVSTFVVEAVEARLSLSKLSFRDILAPVHEDFRRSGMTEAELDTFLQESLTKAREERKSGSGPSALLPLFGNESVGSEIPPTPSALAT